MSKSLLKIFIIILAQLLFWGCNLTEKRMNLNNEQVERVQDEVHDAFESLAASTKKMTWSTYFEHFDKENFTGLNADGTVWLNFQEFKDEVEPTFQSIEKTKSLNFKNIKISVLGTTTAILVNEYKQEVLLKSGQSVQATGGGTQVWSKRSGSWKLVSVSASSGS